MAAQICALERTTAAHTGTQTGAGAGATVGAPVVEESRALGVDVVEGENRKQLLGLVPAQHRQPSAGQDQAVAVIHAHVACQT